MAKPRAKAAPVADAAEIVEYIESGDELQSALSLIYAQAGTSQDEIDAVAHVYLVQPDGDEKIWKGDPSAYDLDKLAHQHGSGVYRLKVYVKDETGQYRMRINKEFKYRLSAEEDARLRDIRAGKLNPSAHAGNGAAPLTAESIAAIVDARVKANTPAPADPLAGAERIVGLLAKFMPQPQAPAPVVSPANALKDSLEMARSLMSLSRDLNGGDSGDRAKPGDLAMNRGIDLLSRMMEKSMNAPAAPAATSISSEVGALPDGLSTEEREQIEMLRMALRFACRAAKAGTPAAQFVDDNYEQISIETIAQLYHDPKWFEVFCGNVPECKQYAPWFNEARTALIAAAQESGELDANGQIVDTGANGDIDAGAGTAGAKPDGGA